MSDSPLIQVSNLGKQFKIYRNPWDRAKEWLTLGKIQRHKGFWALRDISFELRRGESLGIIGPNGAGKSTLLKILTQTLHHSEGNYQVNGRVLSLLELGTGFNPELTGRQNVFYSTQLLGFPRAYLQERLADIEAFADLGEFFDRPFKVYSSGMQARLGFALFAFLKCDLLIIDEVFAVGDIFFRQKCYTRLQELMAEDTAIILVTHALPVIQEYCQETLVLDHGKVVYKGASSEAIKRYLMLEKRPSAAKTLAKTIALDEDKVDGFLSNNGTTNSDGTFWPSQEAFLELSQAVLIDEEWARCTGIALCDEMGNASLIFEQGQQAYFYYEFELLQDIDVPVGGVTIRNERNILVHGKNSFQTKAKTPLGIKRGTRIRFRQSMTLSIGPGQYTFTIGLSCMNLEDYSSVEYMSPQEVATKFFRLMTIENAGVINVVPPFGSHYFGHYGLCDLSGECEVHLVEQASDFVAF